MNNEMPIYLFHEGTNFNSHAFLGCHKHSGGAVFRVYAPNALAVSVVGDFNGWSADAVPMENIGNGIWEAVVKDAKVFDSYKYCVTQAGGQNVLKADPFAFHAETDGLGASKVYFLDGYKWRDDVYRTKKQKKSVYNSPMNIYEVHFGSWKRHEDGSCLTYREMAKELPQYAKDMGYTHIELLPLTEFPYDGSWGYQVTGFFAITSRYGTPHDFMYFVDECHKAGIGVILDWVPAHFPRDEHGLRRFDGTPLFEHPTLEHKSWGTLTFDYGKPEVQSFLISGAMHLLENFHLDGLRVDAVAAMLYLDYDRKQGEWQPNVYGGNINLEAKAFLQKLNTAVFAMHPNALMLAEESTAFPFVSHPVDAGGLGFNFKWNMGWMNDTLQYFATDPLFRKGIHGKLTFSLFYAFSENFLLPVSHDEVVHGKRSLVDKMPGSYDKKFANLRLFFAYMAAHPGKKLSFMGNEFAQFREWDFASQLEWFMLGYPKHAQTQNFVKTLNKLYLKHKPFHNLDFEWTGFSWIVPDDDCQNVVAFKRIDEKKKEVVAIFNLSDASLSNYRIGVKKGNYGIILNTDEAVFGGEGHDTGVSYASEPVPMHGMEDSISLFLPPLTALFLVKENKKERIEC